MKTYSIDLFLTSGIVIRLERLSKSKLDKIQDIIASPAIEKDLFFTFKHEGSRHYLMPSSIRHYVTKKVLL